ncbi:hypothetical protein LXL04_035753 [Taraxacum kok-saghyz]
METEIGKSGSGKWTAEIGKSHEINFISEIMSGKMETEIGKSCINVNSDQDSNCLGLHVVITDSSNVQFLNKVLFYSDRLEIQHIDDASTTIKEPSPSCKNMLQNPFEKFAYTSPQASSAGWRTTKSKMRLPKKAQQQPRRNSPNQRDETTADYPALRKRTLDSQNPSATGDKKTVPGLGAPPAGAKGTKTAAMDRNAARDRNAWGKTNKTSRGKMDQNPQQGTETLEPSSNTGRPYTN